MANLSISKIRENIFSKVQHQKTVAKSSNPFARSSFKGNVLTADVFDSSTKKATPSFMGKLKYSALVGSLSGINSKLQAGIESVVAFGNRMKEGVVGFYNKINEIGSIDVAAAGNAMKARMAEMIEFSSAKKLAQRPVSELREMLTAERAVIEAL